MKNRFAYETQLLQNGIEYVVGCDEAGRGPLAGPVVAAAVLFPSNFQEQSWWHEIADSKKLTPVKRLMLAGCIKQNSLWGVSVVNNRVVDRMNILQASLLAMHRAVQKILQQKDLNAKKILVLIDGKQTISNLNFSQEAVVAGDASVHTIAAASILAKVHRDGLMEKLHNKYPQYGFDAHKGYGTKKHIEAIRQYGLSTVHRESFCGKIF